MKIATFVSLLIICCLSFTTNASAEEGVASYYADSLDGKLTASGEPYDRNAMTAAHPSLPFGTKVKVTNLENNRSVEVLINDRGPHTKDRIIDLSHAAAQKLDLIHSGTAIVRIDKQSP